MLSRMSLEQRKVIAVAIVVAGMSSVVPMLTPHHFPLAMLTLALMGIGLVYAMAVMAKLRSGRDL